MRRIHPAAVVLVVFAFVTPAAAEVQQIYGPYFVADPTHTSRVLIHNKRIDFDVSLKVYALVGEGERVLLAAATLRPKEWRAFEVNAQLIRAAGRTESAGGVLVEYDFFEKQPLDGSILDPMQSNASAYEIYNSFQYPICWWAPTCQGRCSVNLYRSFATTSSCYPAGQPYIQCFGLTANGKCLLPAAVCTPQAAAGFCT